MTGRTEDGGGRGPAADGRRALGSGRGGVVATAALLGACFACPAALAGPPFETDDPEPVKKGHGEFYVATQDAWTSAGSAGTLPHLELNYGPIRDVQLHVILPLAYVRPEGGGASAYGPGDTELGVKWRFVHEDGPFRGCPQVGTFVQVEAPTGSESRGLGTGHAQTFVPIWLQKSWGAEKRRWTTYGGGGRWFRDDAGSRDSWFVGWLVQRQVTDALAVGGELFHATPESVGGSSRTAFNLGGQWDLSVRWHALFSAGRDLSGPNRLAAYAALQLTF